VPAALAMIRRPVGVEPVNVMTSTIGLPVSPLPASAPPGTTLSTPAGTPASVAARAISNASRGVQGCGLSTIVQPAASAGVALNRFSWNG